MKKSMYMPLLAITATSLLVTGCFGAKDKPVADQSTVIEQQNDTPAATKEPVEVLKGMQVTVHYIGRLQGDEGAAQADIIADCDAYEVFDTSREDVAKACGTFTQARNYAQLFSFVAGQGMVIPGFDQAVIGKKVGETVSVSIPSAQAYGEWSEDKIVPVKLSELPPKAETGATYEVGEEMNTPYGPVKIYAIDGDDVKIDANHPLAGKDLIFDIEIIDAEKTPESAAFNKEIIENIEQKAEQAQEELKELADDAEKVADDVVDAGADAIDATVDAVDTAGEVVEDVAQEVKEVVTE